MKNTLTGRLASVALGAVLALALVMPQAPVRAQTLADLQAQIAQLMAQIAALQGTSVGGEACPYVWTRSLTVGSTGADVLKLQQFLNASADTRLAITGAGAPGMETQYYGPVTAAAVSKFQVKYRANVLTPLGLINPTGYFGPSSIAKANSLCISGGSTVPPGNQDDELRGGAGSIEEADFISNLSNEEVGEGQRDVEVAGLEIEPDGSDVELTAVRLTFDYGDTVNGSSDDFDDYIDEVSILLDGEEVARVDGDEFQSRNDFSRSINLENGAIIREGRIGELVVAVSALRSIDSEDEGEEWSVEFDSIRFRDAQGAFLTDSSTGDIGNTRTFSIESFVTATDAELSISDGEEDINDARVINVDDSSRTNDVELFSMMVEAEGDSDMTIEELVVAFDFTGTASEMNDMLSEIHLIVDGDDVASENARTGTTITFDDLDIEIDSGDEVEFIIAADFLRLNDGTYAEGDTIRVYVSATERNAWEVEDERGDELANSDKTGTASSDAHVVFDQGFVLDLVDISETKGRSSSSSGVGDQAQYTFKYEVTAIDGDIYIDNSCTEDNDGNETASAGNSYSVTNADDNVTNCTLTSSAPSASNSFRVREGRTETFTLTVAVTAVDDNFASVALESIGWATGAGNGTNVYDANLPGDFESRPIYLNMP